jgi:hypothetical protein
MVDTPLTALLFGDCIETARGIALAAFDAKCLVDHMRLLPFARDGLRGACAGA